jgi:Flp pilus assembly secretin CpaC
MTLLRSRSHSTNRIGALLAVILMLAGDALAQPAAAPAANPAKAQESYLSGARQLERKDFPAAEADFARAAALSPAREDYAVALALTREHHVSELIQQAAQARENGDKARSKALLAEAHGLDPENAMVNQHLAAAGLMASGGTMGPALLRTVAVPINQPWQAGLATLAGPIELAPSTASKAFDLRGDTRDLVRQVAAAYGLQASFDDSVTRQQLRFALGAAPYGETMPILLRMARLFTVPLSPKQILVAKDTPENRQRLERQLQETIYVPGSTSTELSELGNIVKNVFDVKLVSVQANGGNIIVRAPEQTLKAVNYVLADLIDGGSQVVLELKLYAVEKTRTRDIGIAPPQSVGVVSTAAEAQSLVAANQSSINQAIAQGLITLTGNYYQNLATEAFFLLATGLASDSSLSGIFGILGGGATTLGVSAPAVTFNLGLNSSDTRELDEMQVRVGDGQTTTFRVGSRYPITTSTYSSGLSSATTSALSGVTINGVSAATLAAQYLGAGTSVTVPQVQYEDIGLTLKTQPAVQRSGLVSLHVELKIEALTGQSGLGSNPVLTSRYLTSDVTVPEGTAAVLVSSVSKTESAAVDGIPGLGDLPGFQGAADRLAEVDSSDLVLTITPHVVRRRANLLYSPRIVFNIPAGTDY